MSVSKYLGGLLGGAFEGARLGVVHALDSTNDDNAKKMLSTILRKVKEGTQLPPDRQKRLLGLLREVVDELHKEM